MAAASCWAVSGCAGADECDRARRRHPSAAAASTMAALNALPAGEGLEFTRLKSLTGATDGNSGAHIETLAKAAYGCR